ncbi:hypothetical protein A2U01_0034826, partial [Trifolium medium]|nr:hypothetical protein [Trifolium medium]
TVGDGLHNNLCGLLQIVDFRTESARTLTVLSPSLISDPLMEQVVDLFSLLADVQPLAEDSGK